MQFFKTYDVGFTTEAFIRHATEDSVFDGAVGAHEVILDTDTRNMSEGTNLVSIRADRNKWNWTAYASSLQISDVCIADRAMAYPKPFIRHE